ncbi:MAG: TetR/AcrR family transcriptional regulator [Chloroflexi bacterium]|nr:MAG: TetR/AcrR family transcriptional regulator [Chloroflexota bacterium]
MKSLMKADREVKRPYQSALRGAQAQYTREAVIAAAGRLFSEHGYAATSIEEIAAAAGVSRATVFTSVGGKAKLLKTALDVAIVGDDEPIPLPERPRSKAIRAEPDPRKYLALYAGLVTEMDGRMAAIHEAVRGAAGVDPDARALWESQLAQHRQGAVNVIGDVMRKGGLRPGLDPDAAADIVWLLGPGAYHMLVHRRGWSPERFQTWLTETFIRQLLPDEDSSSRHVSSKGRRRGVRTQAGS